MFFLSKITSVENFSYDKNNFTLTFTIIDDTAYNIYYYSSNNFNIYNSKTIKFSSANVPSG